MHQLRAKEENHGHGLGAAAVGPAKRPGVILTLGVAVTVSQVAHSEEPRMN